MASPRLIFFFASIIIEMVAFTMAQPEFILKSCYDTGNYTSNSVYRSNLNSLLSSLSSNTNINYGFYNLSFGQDPDRAYAIALCRGDILLDDCRSCVNDSTRRILQDCPNQKEAIGWYDNCMIQFSNKSIFGIMQSAPMWALLNVNNATSIDQFNQVLRSLLDSLRSQAASGGSLRKYATGNATGPDFQTIYALSQCTPDLSDVQCSDCLIQAAENIPTCCNGKIGAQVITPSCKLRYEISRFYNSTVPLPSPPPPTISPLSPPPKEKESNTTRTVVIIVLPIVCAAILIISLCIFIRLRKPRKKPVSPTVGEMRNAESLQFDFATVRAATDNFSDANKLGQGGFGAVYKVVMKYGYMEKNNIGW